MQTFSIAVGQYEGYRFQVNAVNTAIVEMSFREKRTSEEGEEGEFYTTIEFNRNAGILNVTRTPVDQMEWLRRDVTTGRPRLATEQEMQAEQDRRDEAERQQREQTDKSPKTTRQTTIDDDVRKPPKDVPQRRDLGAEANDARADERKSV